MVIFTGQTRDCFSRFFDQVYANWTAEEQRIVTGELEEFFKTSHSAIQSWIHGKTFPKGLGLLKVRYMLRQCGFTIVEENEESELDEAVVFCGDLLASDLITLADATAYLRYSGTDETLRYLLGRRKVGAKGLVKFKQFNDEFQEFRFSLVTFDFPETRSAPPAMPQNEPSLPIRPMNGDKEPDWLASLAHILKNVQAECQLSAPWLKSLLSEDFGPETRRKFRDLLGDDFAFKLAKEITDFQTLAYALCSEKARENRLGYPCEVRTINELPTTED